MSLKSGALACVGEAVDAWASKKGANVSSESFDHELSLWKHLTGKKRVGNVLEVGSGSGLFLMYLVAKGFSEVGTGIDPVLEGHGTQVDEIENTRTLAKSLGLSDRLAFARLSLEQFMCKERCPTFDIIMFRLCLHHVYERRRIKEEDAKMVARCMNDLAELRTLLSEGGCLYIREEYAPTWIHGKAFNLYHRLKGAPIINWREKRSPAEWTGLLERAGYHNVKAVRLPPNRLTKTWWMKRIGIWLSSAFLIAATK